MENQTQEQLVSIGDDQELNYWSKEFGIAKEELIAVFKQGGTFASAVENYVKTLQYSL
ncbi:DUF3606 domain-containing protein [Mucilaginibacter sp. X5P1]|uniref:DUF3606 domain-containing protein n=1 Tax=Mucilaginibacter sp. X5P1 TaxID=2723088 RepID=UPI00161077E7|nr:DUF3606 domain-containing protein [Mucilaginibacter sp. X5P1]MBB6137157.1 hypothetical protein [Mucilaginibacter sp. X5P1]